jgi:hypothetical protein
MRVGERPAHILHIPMIGARRANEVWVLSFAVPVSWAEDACTIAVALWTMKLVREKLEHHKLFSGIYSLICIDVVEWLIDMIGIDLDDKKKVEG